MAVETTDIRTLKAVERVVDYNDNVSKSISYFYGYHDVISGKRKVGTEMKFISVPNYAKSLPNLTPKEEAQILSEARNFFEDQHRYSSFQKKSLVSIDWVDIRIVITTDITITDVDPSEEMLTEIRQDKIKNLTPLEIRALGLQSEAVYLKIANE
jgi:hypothetical protein